VPSLTIENYVKAIYQLDSGHENRPAQTGQLAAALGVLPGTVTSMMKTLSDSGLAIYTPYEGVRLTEAGRTLALRVVRRHRLIELFLVQTLQLTWDEVHEEAENMEHAVSDLLVDRIDTYLGYPVSDPHGDPIPRADGTFTAVAASRMDEWPSNQPFRIARVLDQSPEFLRYLGEVGLTLGAIATITGCNHAAGLFTIKLDQQSITLAATAAARILITRVPK
jgi:DtxR family Mn-dependent transcriptional regulator